MTKDDAIKLALEALELAQDNLREHGDNCFLHDEGEYNRCFCGKDSVSDHLQSVVEKLDEALAEQQEHVANEQDAFEQKFPMPRYCSRFTGGYAATDHNAWDAHSHCLRWEGWKARANTTPPRRESVGLTEEEIWRFWES